MNQQKSLLRISELLSRFKIQVGILNANAQLDINIVAEDILIPILNIAYNCNFKNAKYSEDDARFPALDLLDKDNRVAIQITSTATIEKVKKTLKGIIVNNFHSQFDTFYIYIITQKQNSYDKNILKATTGNSFLFTEKNILDEKDLYIKISSLPYDDILIIEKLLEKQFSDLVNYDNKIQTEITQIIAKMKINYEEEFIISEIEGASKTRQIWLTKKIFLEQKLPTISDINQQFTIYSQIAEATDKIAFYNNQISNSLIQISQ
jgi:hypothetical protein